MQPHDLAHSFCSNDSIYTVQILCAGILKCFPILRPVSEGSRQKKLFHTIQCNTEKIRSRAVNTSRLSLCVIMKICVHEELSLCMKAVWFADTRCGFVESETWKDCHFQPSSGFHLLILWFQCLSTVFFSFLLLFWGSKSNRFWEQQRYFSPSVSHSTGPPPSQSWPAVDRWAAFPLEDSWPPQGQGLELGGALQSVDTRPRSQD